MSNSSSTPHRRSTREVRRYSDPVAFGVTLRGGKKRMKLFCGFVWILVTLLVGAAVDRVPDPPAESRDFTRLTISSPQRTPVVVSAPALVFVPCRMQIRTVGGVLPVAASAPADRIAAIEQGTDPSPPSPLV